MLSAAPSANAPLWRSAVTLAGGDFRPGGARVGGRVAGRCGRTRRSGKELGWRWARSGIFWVRDFNLEFVSKWITSGAPDGRSGARNHVLHGVLGFTIRSRDRVPQDADQGPLKLVYLDLGGTTVELMCYPDSDTSSRARPGRAAGLRRVDGAGGRATWTARSRSSRTPGRRAELGAGAAAEHTRAPGIPPAPDGNAIELRQWSPSRGR